MFIDNRGGVSNIWLQPLAGGEPKQLTNFKSDLIFSFDWSRDRQLACSRGIVTSDVVHNQQPQMINEWRRDGYLISTDKRLLDVRCHPRLSGPLLLGRGCAA